MIAASLLLFRCLRRFFKPAQLVADHTNANIKSVDQNIVVKTNFACTISGSEAPEVLDEDTTILSTDHSQPPDPTFYRSIF